MEKKRNNNHYLCLLILLLGSIGAYANDSLLFTQFVEQLNKNVQRPAPKGSQAYHFAYKVIVTPWELEAGVRNTQNIDMVVRENSMSLKGDDFEMHQNQKGALIVSHIHKMIFLTESIQEDIKKNQAAMQSGALAEMIENVKDYSFGKEENGLIELTIKLEAEFSLNKGISQVRVMFDKSSLRVHRVITEYLPTMPFKKQVVHVLKEDYNFPSVKVLNDVTRYVMDRKGGLLPAYKGYTVNNEMQ